MTCYNRCYQIGGPWIDYDPECPEHGTVAREEISRTRQLDLDRDTRIAALEKAIEDLKARIECLENAGYGEGSVI